MKQFLPLLLALILLTGCGTVKKSTNTVYAMDTVMSLTAYGDQAETALMDATSEIHRLDSLLSAALEGSEIGQINCDRDVSSPGKRDYCSSGHWKLRK